jgi:hypothetical protein
MMVNIEQSLECELAGETCPSATLSTTNPTWREPDSNSGRRGGKPPSNCLTMARPYSQNVAELMWEGGAQTGVYLWLSYILSWSFSRYMFRDEASLYRVECLTFETRGLNITTRETNIFASISPFSVYIYFNRVRGCGNKRFKRNCTGLLKEFLGFHIGRFI